MASTSKTGEGNVCFHSCWGKSARWPDPAAGPAPSEAPYPTPVLGMCHLLTISQPEPFLRTEPRKSHVLLRPSGRCMWLNPVKVSVSTFKVLVGGAEISMFPGFWNLPPIGPGGLPLSSAPPCPSCMEATFIFHLGSTWVWAPSQVEWKNSSIFELFFDGWLMASAKVVCLLWIKQTQMSSSTRVIVKSLPFLNPGKAFYCTRRCSVFCM